MSSEYCFRIREGDDTVKLCRQFSAEASVNKQIQFHSAGDVFLVVRIGGNFHDHLHSLSFQLLHHADGERVGVVVRTHVDQLDIFLQNVFYDAL